MRRLLRAGASSFFAIANWAQRCGVYFSLPGWVSRRLRESLVRPPCVRSPGSWRLPSCRMLLCLSDTIKLSSIGNSRIES